MKKLGQGLSVLLLLSLTVFVAQNLQVVELSFLGWRQELTLAVPILGAYFLGGLTARPILRLLSRQRSQQKMERKAQKAAERAVRAQASGGTADTSQR